MLNPYHCSLVTCGSGSHRAFFFNSLNVTFYFFLLLNFAVAQAQPQPLGLQQPEQPLGQPQRLQQFLVEPLALDQQEQPQALLIQVTLWLSSEPPTFSSLLL